MVVTVPPKVNVQYFIFCKLNFRHCCVLPLCVLVVYGLTETSPVTHGVPRSTVDTKAPAIGLPVPNTHMKVRSKTKVEKN